MNDAKQGAVSLTGLPLRFDSGTYSGSIITSDKVILAHNVHANVGFLMVEMINAHTQLLAERDALVAALQGGRQKLATYQAIYFGDKELRRLLAEWDVLLKAAKGEAEAPSRTEPK